MSTRLELTGCGTIGGGGFCCKCSKKGPEQRFIGRVIRSNITAGGFDGYQQ
jgi:hypothetical protein